MPADRACGRRSVQQSNPIRVPGKVHAIDAQLVEHLVHAASTMIGRRHGLGLHTGAGLAKQIDRIDGEFACQSRDVLCPHGRGRPEAMQQHQWNATIRPVLIDPHDTEFSLDIVGRTREWRQRPHAVIDCQITAARFRVAKARLVPTTPQPPSAGTCPVSRTWRIRHRSAITREIPPRFSPQMASQDFHDLVLCNSSHGDGDRVGLTNRFIS
jgi:hypothetical protein